MQQGYSRRIGEVILVAYLSVLLHIVDLKNIYYRRILLERFGRQKKVRWISKQHKNMPDILVMWLHFCTQIFDS
jgi:hypothetical protein